MNGVVLDLGERHRTFPKSVQPGIPKLGKLKPGWRRVKIGELFHVVNRPCQLNDSDTYRLVTVKRSRGGIESRGDLMGSEIAVKSQFYIEEGDFLISKRQIVHGACAVVEADFAGSIVSNEYAVLHCKPALDIDFLRQLIHSIYFQETCFHSSLGVHVEKMIFSTPDWFRWKIDIPEINEQHQIADFLGSVDERIKLLQRRRDAFAQYKAGMMQRLFDQSLRFTREDGSAFPDWGACELGSLFDWVATNSLSREMLTDEVGTVQNIHYGDIHGKFAARFRQSVESAPFIRPDALPPIIRDDAFCQSGDVVIADASEDYADIGKAIEIIEVTPRSLVAGLHTYIARPKAGMLALGFSGYLFQTWALRQQMMRIAQGISVLGISKPKLSKLELRLPHTDEQRKITDFLGALDDKIAAASAQINQMQAFKKGLLQQIFV